MRFAAIKCILTLALALVVMSLARYWKGAQKYHTKGSQTQTQGVPINWRVIKSILQSEVLFTVSSLSFTITQFETLLGYALCHYVFPCIVVRLLQARLVDG